MIAKRQAQSLIHQLFGEDKENILVLHIHKAGGTTVCEFFKEQHREGYVTLSSFLNNCNGMQSLQHQSCSADGLRMMRSRKHRLVFFCEGHFKSSNRTVLPHGFVGIALVRHPTHLVLSHMVHAWQLSPERLKHDRQRLNHLTQRWLSGKSGSEYSRDFQVTTITGGIDSLELATARIDQFTAVFPTVKISDGLSALESTLHLKHVPREEHNDRKGGRLKDHLNMTLQKRILQENTNDMLLYQHAVSLRLWEVDNLRNKFTERR